MNNIERMREIASEEGMTEVGVMYDVGAYLIERLDAILDELRKSKAETQATEIPSNDSNHVGSAYAVQRREDYWRERAFRAELQEQLLRVAAKRNSERADRAEAEHIEHLRQCDGDKKHLQDVGHSYIERAERAERALVASRNVTDSWIKAHTDVAMRAEKAEAALERQVSVQLASAEAKEEWRSRCEKAEARVRELESWQLSVADQLGYVNHPEGQSGYEVADAETVKKAIRDVAYERDLALDLARRWRELAFEQSKQDERDALAAEEDSEK